LLIVLLFGIVEFGRALLQENTLTKAVVTGARYVARAPGAVTETKDSGGNITGCASGSNWSTVTAQARLLIERGSRGTGDVILPGLEAADAISFLTPRLVTVSITLPGGGESSVSACVVEVEAAAQFAALSGDSLVPLLQIGPITLNAQAEERYLGE
jgi:Flp pilus assembly protein TadG